MDRTEGFRLVDAAQAELTAIQDSEKNAAEHLRETVALVYREADITQADLARYLRRHRNTIATWCA